MTARISSTVAGEHHIVYHSYRVWGYFAGLLLRSHVTLPRALAGTGRGIRSTPARHYSSRRTRVRVVGANGARFRAPLRLARSGHSHDTTHHGTAQSTGTPHHGTVRHGTAQHDTTRHDHVTRYGTASLRTRPRARKDGNSFVARRSEPRPRAAACVCACA